MLTSKRLDGILDLPSVTLKPNISAVLAIARLEESPFGILDKVLDGAPRRGTGCLVYLGSNFMFYSRVGHRESLFTEVDKLGRISRLDLSAII